MPIQQSAMKLMVLHSQSDKTFSPDNISRRDSGKMRWRISLYRPSSSSSSSADNSPLKQDIPAEFLCPISGSLMSDPVIVSSGHSFERACAVACKTIGFAPTSLFPTSPPDFSTVIPNLALKSAIVSWCTRKSIPPPKSPDPAAAEKLVRALMEKTLVSNTNPKVSVSEKELIQAIKDKPSVRLDHAATELDRRPSYFHSSSDDSVASSSRPFQLATRPSCFSSPSSGEIDLLNPNPTPEEEALLVKLKSPRMPDVEEALISLRQVTRIDEASRTRFCTARLISALRSLIVSRYTTIQVNAAAVLVNLSLERSNKVKMVRSGIVPPLVDVLKSGGSPEAQEHAAGALFSLALEDENKTAIGVLGALEPLLHLLRVGTELTRHDSALALYHLSLVQSNRSKLVKLGAVSILLNMAKSDQMTGRVLLILCNMASCPVSRPALLDSGAVECTVGLLRGPNELDEATRESCVAVLYGLSHGGGLRFKGLAMAANAAEVLTKVERTGRERARQKARRVLEAMRAKAEEPTPENEDIDWEELLGSGAVTRAWRRLGGGGEEQCANSSEF